MFLVFIPDECIFFPLLSLLDQILFIFSDAFLRFSSASDPATDEVLEVLERLCIQLLCIYVAGANKSSNEITPEFIGRWFIP